MSENKHLTTKIPNFSHQPVQNFLSHSDQLCQHSCQFLQPRPTARSEEHITILLMNHHFAHNFEAIMTKRRHGGRNRIHSLGNRRGYPMKNSVVNGEGKIGRFVPQIELKTRKLTKKWEINT